MLNDKGVSEVIGAILLVSLVILGAMIVAVLFLSQPPPQEIPQVNAIAGNNTTHIFLLHDGGDLLSPMETIIRIDGRADPVPAGDIELLREDGSVEEPSWTSGEWSVGKTLRIRDDQTPQSVSLVYSGGSSQALLLTSTFVETVSGGGGGPEPPPCLPIVAGFSGTPPSGSNPLTVQFTDQSTGSPTAWQWNFGDGSANSPIQNPSHTYTADGTYTVTLTASKSAPGCSSTDTVTKSGYIVVNPCIPVVAAFSGTPTSGTAPLVVNLNDLSTGSPTTWQWNFGDGTVNSSDKNPSHTYTAAGTYTVTLTALKSAPGCSSSDTVTKSGYITVSTPTPDCGTISGYKWNDLDGNGEWDPGEPGLSGWTINLYYRTTGQTYIFDRSNTTNTAGFYIFTGLDYQGAYHYKVTETIQEGWENTYPENGEYINIVLNPGSKCYAVDKDFRNKEIPPPQAKNTKLITDRGGYINSNGYIQFKIIDAYSHITIKNILYPLPINSEIKLVVNSDSNTADIDMNSNHISNFDLPDVSLYIGGILRETGTVSDIWISEFSNYESTLQLTVPGGGNKVWTEFVYDGNTLINGDDHSTIRIYDLQPDSSQYLRLGITSNHIDYFGGANGYSIN